MNDFESDNPMISDVLVLGGRRSLLTRLRFHRILKIFASSL